MKQLEKEIPQANQIGMMKRFQMYGSKASKLEEKTQEKEKKEERK